MLQGNGLEDEAEGGIDGGYVKIGWKEMSLKTNRLGGFGEWFLGWNREAGIWRR